MRIADGVEEVFEAGDAFFIGPGEVPHCSRTGDPNRILLERNGTGAGKRETILCRV
jgi:quercetin dioxygenase-like cupin family protein